MTNEEVLEYLGNLNVMQLISLTKELEEKWGVKAVPQVSNVAPAPKQEVKEEAAAEVSVILAAVPADKKISVIKVLREIINAGLKEAKEFTESAPKVLREAVSKEEAELIAQKLTEAGATVEIK
jgi:large subunit ribosomal protein L7/L12